MSLVVLSVSGVTNEPHFERVRRAFMGWCWLWPKHFVEKSVEHKTQAAFQSWLKAHASAIAPADRDAVRAHDTAQPLLWINGVTHVRSFDALLSDVMRPIFRVGDFAPRAAGAGAGVGAAVAKYEINTSGFATCIWFQRATAVAQAFADMFPERVHLTVHSKVDRTAFKTWLPVIHAQLVANHTRAAHLALDAAGAAAAADESDADAKERITSHGGSPLNWFGAAAGVAGPTTFLGGCDNLCAWLRARAPLPPPPPPPLPFDVKALDDTDTPGDAKHAYDYDLVVIGGGSGGLACSKEAAGLGARVAVIDFVSPTPVHGTTWGLGGTCVNVGCIPKKLMHTAALHGEHATDAHAFGWDLNPPAPAVAPAATAGSAVVDAKSGATASASASAGAPATAASATRTHNWSRLVANVQRYIKTLNDGYTAQLKSKRVTYVNATARFVDPHTISCTDAKGVVTNLTARRFVLAVGGRPQQPTLRGAELCITSDDLFSLRHPPGRDVLVVGASYVALECAGFLHGLGSGVQVMVRSVVLRGFDVACADRISDYMEAHGIVFHWEYVPVSVERLPKHDGAGSDGGRLRVSFVPAAQEKRYLADPHAFPADLLKTTVVDTVLFAIGRTASTAPLNLAAAGVRVDAATHKIPMVHEQTSARHIYALGDCATSHQPGLAPLALELTPVAIAAGKLLAKRLYGAAHGAAATMEYRNVCTTVFTPLEYGCVGYSEEGAYDAFGQHNVDVWHASFQPLEMALSGRMNDDKTQCYVKLLTHRADSERVVGFHILAPNAGEITQGIGVAMRCRATKADFDATIGIHPTVAEQFTTLTVTKRSGADAAKTGC